VRAGEAITSTFPSTFTYDPAEIKTAYEVLKKPNSDSVAKKIMTSVVKFATDLTLSAEEKALRKAGLKDESGYTKEAVDVVIDMEAKSRGYKHFQELVSTVGSEDFSPFELDDFFKKYEKELLEIAKEYNEENKCK
jgi:hypothetical protein